MNKTYDREELFERTPVWSAIFKLTIPMILSSLVSMIYNLADTYFVGKLDDPVQNAAVTLAAPAMTLFYAITNLFGVGASSLMSRSLGEKKPEKVKKAAATGIWCGFVLAVLLSVVTLVFNRQTLSLLGTNSVTYDATKQYLFWTVGLGSVPAVMSILLSYLLRAEGHSMTAGIGIISGCLLNIVLDPFFILPMGLHMGAAGAGFATFISNCLACLFFIGWVIANRKKSLVSANVRNVSFERSIFLDICIVGIPGVFQNILNVIGMTIFNNLAADYGENAVAAIGIANKINQLPIQIIFGFTQGVMPLIGYTYAAKNYPRMKETIRKLFAITLSCLAVVCVLFLTLGEPMVRIFMKNAEIVSVGGSFLVGFGIALPFMSVDFAVVGISQSFGMGKYALAFSFLRKLALEIPLMIVINRKFGLSGLPFAEGAAEIVMCILACFVLRHLMKKTGNVPESEPAGRETV